jgi:predicted PurR-regulated permease PerM
LLVLVQAISGAVHGLSRDLPHIVDKARHSDVGKFINGGSDSLETLRKHASDITAGVGKASGGIAHVGASAFGVVTLALSVIFLTLFGLIEEPRVRDWTGSLLYRDKRERYLRLTDRIIQTTSRYMLGNLAISVVCGTVYGITAVILGLPYPFALAVIAGILDLIPNIGATTAGIIIGIVALSVSVQALIVFLIVIVVYQQIENYILQPTIIGKAAKISGFTVLASVLAFGALFGLVGAIIGVPIAAGVQIIVDELTAGRRARIAAADDATQEANDGREAQDHDGGSTAGRR